MKKYWDIVCGTILGGILSILADFKLDRVQLCYSIIFLILACIGLFRIIKQAIEKAHDEKARSPTVVDNMVDKQPPFKAFKIAESPIEMGEKTGRKIINLWRETQKIMEKLKEFFDKFKGFMLAFALAVLGCIEAYGGIINDLFSGMLVINGIPVIAAVTLAASFVVSLISNPYSKDVREKIKEWTKLDKPVTDEIIDEQMKKKLKEDSTDLAHYNKALATQERELASLENELAKFNTTFEAKKKMFEMIPQLATGEEVAKAEADVKSCNDKIGSKKMDIENTKNKIAALTTEINALKVSLNEKK